MLETLNKLLYNSKKRGYSILHFFSIFSAIATLGLTIYGFGFYLSIETMHWIFQGLDILFFTFVANYAIRWLYSFKRSAFIKRTWFELLLILVVLLNFLLKNYYLFENERTFYKKYVVVYLIILSLFEFVKISTRIHLARYKPSILFLSSFILLIAGGTLLLMLPASTYGEASMPFTDALFTATSASCATGLVVVDTSTFFTPKGQFFILFLIQMGGLGIITFATFFATLFSKGVGIKHHIMHDIYSTESLVSGKKLFRTIIFISLAIEFLFSIALFFTWGDAVKFNSLGEKIYYSVFHAISAFCNAGFSLFSNGMHESLLRNAYLLHLVIAFAVILGGLGFPAIEDIFNIRKMRERLKYPWKDWQLSTKVSVYTSAGLILFGMLVFYTLELDNTLQGMNLMEALITSFFQSVVARTAGFNTVDISHITEGAAFMLIFLMFIGASPASTGGGIKTSTFLIIVLTAIATIREKGKVEIGKRTIPKDIIFRAFSIFAFAITFNFICLFVLILVEPNKKFMDLAFEQVSAFGTVGLTKGITPFLSHIGKITIVFTMFVGRVGLLTLAWALSRSVATTAYVYPNAHLTVG